MGGSTPNVKPDSLKEEIALILDPTEVDKVISCQDQTTSSLVELEAGEIGSGMNSVVLLFYWTFTLKEQCMLSENLEHYLSVERSQLYRISFQVCGEEQRPCAENRTVSKIYFLAPVCKCE